MIFLAGKDEKIMRLWVDADACPVVDLAIACAGRHGIEVTLVCDTAHVMQREGAQTIVVSQGADSADLALVNRARKGDLVVTQDYGVAAMALGKGCRALDQNGREYTQWNMDGLLMMRHENRKIRMGGGRTKGPGKRTKDMDRAFLETMERILSEIEA